MQTIEEYKAYTMQLEGEVGKWHHAYDDIFHYQYKEFKIKEGENK